MEPRGSPADGVPAGHPPPIWVLQPCCLAAEEEKKRLGMNLGDFPACTSPWQIHVAGARTDPPAHGKPHGWGSAVGLLLANPGIPAWDAVPTKEVFGVFAGVPPKPKRGT